MQLVLPSGNASYVLGNTITVTATATDSDGSIAQVAFYDGNSLLATVRSAPYTISGTAALGAHVVTAVATDNQGATTRSAPVTITVVAAGGVGSGSGLLGSYFSNRDLAGSPVSQRTEAVSFNWGTGAPAPGLPSDNFSVRWQGFIEAPISGAYQLQTLSDDGVRVSIEGRRVIDNWTPHGATLDTTGNLIATAGQRYRIVVEYQEFGGEALIQLRWKPPGASDFVVVPVDRLYAP